MGGDNVHANAANIYWSIAIFVLRAGVVLRKRRKYLGCRCF